MIIRYLKCRELQRKIGCVQCEKANLFKFGYHEYKLYISDSLDERLEKYIKEYNGLKYDFMKEIKL